MCFLGASTKGAQREQVKMPRWIKMDPGLLKQPVSYALNVGRHHHELAARLEHPSARHERANWMSSMLDDMVHGDGVKTVVRKHHFFQGTLMYRQSGMSTGDTDSLSIGLYSDDFPAKILHLGQELTVATTHIQKPPAP